MSLHSVLFDRVHDEGRAATECPRCHSAGRWGGESECPHSAACLHRGQAEARGRDLNCTHLPGKVSPHRCRIVGRVTPNECMCCGQSLITLCFGVAV